MHAAVVCRGALELRVGDACCVGEDAGIWFDRVGVVGAAGAGEDEAGDCRRCGGSSSGLGEERQGDEGEDVVGGMHIWCVLRITGRE